jgi:flagellar hook-associated protein 1
MSSLTSALRIGTAGLQFSQVGLGTVSHNLVNSNTEGYSRQQVQSSAVSSNGFGAGVELNNIQRVTDRFLNLRMLSATSDAAQADIKQDYLDTIEGAVTNSSGQGSIESIVGNMFKAMNELTNDPGSSALKRNVVQQGELTAQTVRDIATDLAQVGTDADNAITAELNTVNQLLVDIHRLNKEIAAQSLGSAGGANTNDFRDQRDLKISQLAQRFGIQVTENTSSGGVRISTESGRKLVDEASYVVLRRTTGSPYTGIGAQNTQVDGTLSATVLDIDTATLTTGKIKGLTEVRDTLVPNLQAQITEFTTQLRTTINTLHSQGSSFPPVRTLTSGNTAGLTGTTSNLYTDLSASLAGATFNVSIVNSNGDVALSTTSTTPITLPGAGPFTLDDLATLINNNITVGNGALGAGGVTAVATTDASGNPILQVQAANSNQRVVLSSVNGDMLGILGMNNFFTGTTPADLQVKSTLSADPNQLATARMNADGSLSSRNTQNIVPLAQLSDTTISFNAAGGLGAQTDTAVGYLGQVISNLAVTLNAGKDRATFTDGLKNQLAQLTSSVSGVNINEELSQMLIYQNSFQASSRIITVVNQLLEELVNTIR